MSTPVLSRRQRIAKLRKLCDHEGYSDLEMLFAAVMSDSVSPAICVNEDCDYICEMEPDQDRGYCDDCRTNTMQSVPILAGLI